LLHRISNVQGEGQMIQQRPTATAATAALGGHAGGQSASTGNGSTRSVRSIPEKSATPLLVPLKSAAAIWGVSCGTFHRLRREGRVPEPIELGPRALRWVVADLQEAIAQMPRKTVANAEPAQLLRTRIERAKKTGDLS
jgi:predicted DNA-binding transcriptional regulator AlpA